MLLFKNFWFDVFTSLFSVVLLGIVIFGFITIGMAIQDDRATNNCYKYHKDQPYEVVVQTCDAILNGPKETK